MSRGRRRRDEGEPKKGEVEKTETKAESEKDTAEASKPKKRSSRSMSRGRRRSDEGEPKKEEEEKDNAKPSQRRSRSGSRGRPSSNRDEAPKNAGPTSLLDPSEITKKEDSSERRMRKGRASTLLQSEHGGSTDKLNKTKTTEQSTRSRSILSQSEHGGSNKIKSTEQPKKSRSRSNSRSRGRKHSTEAAAGEEKEKIPEAPTKTPERRMRKSMDVKMSQTWHVRSDKEEKSRATEAIMEEMSSSFLSFGTLEDWDKGEGSPKQAVLVNPRLQKSSTPSDGVADDQFPKVGRKAKMSITDSSNGMGPAKEKKGALSSKLSGRRQSTAMGSSESVSSKLSSRRQSTARGSSESASEAGQPQNSRKKSKRRATMSSAIPSTGVSTRKIKFVSKIEMKKSEAPDDNDSV
jgi:hypothetical protein